MRRFGQAGWRRLAVAAIALAAFGGAGGSATAARIALVIGNQDYANLPKLEKSVGDAEAFAALFKEKGYDKVILKQDLTREGMDEAIADFAARISPGDTATFVYSGHGWSDGSQNYIVGVDAPDHGTQTYLKRISLPLRNGADGIVDEMNASGATLKIAIIDACRDNPFATPSGTKSIGMTRGFARMEAVPPDGTFMVFSAGAGQSALDRLGADDANPNGVFTRSFIPLLRSDMTLLDATKAVQKSVYLEARAIGYAQQPAYYDETLGNDVCITAVCTREQSVAPDEQAWQSIAHSTDPADFSSFLRLFPTSAHAEEAREHSSPPAGRPISDAHYLLDSSNADAAEVEAFLSQGPIGPVREKYAENEVMGLHGLRNMRGVTVTDFVFDQDRATIARAEVSKLGPLADAILAFLKKHPSEKFLIEEHDAASVDTSLTDKRAENFARILEDFFDIPPANLITQGFNESAQNPSGLDGIVVRRVTPLLAAQL